SLCNPISRLASGRSSLIIALLHGLQRPVQTRLGPVAQRDEGFSELLAAGLHPQTRIVADTVDGAEDAVDRWQDSINARDRLTQSAVMMNEFGTVIAGNLAKMRDMTVTAADIKETANGIGRIGTGLAAGRYLRIVLGGARILLALLCHRPLLVHQQPNLMVPLDFGATLLNLIITVKIKDAI